MSNTFYGPNDRFIPTWNNPHVEVLFLSPDSHSSLFSAINEYADTLPLSYKIEIISEFIAKRFILLDPLSLRKGAKFTFFNIEDDDLHFTERSNKFDGIIQFKSKPWVYIEVKYGSTQGFHISKFELKKAFEQHPNYFVIRVNPEKKRGKWNIRSISIIKFLSTNYISQKIKRN